MLIGMEAEPFDDPNYLYELKIDGERCMAYLGPDGTDLRSKRNMCILPQFPELNEIHKQINKRCILDGELAVIENGKPSFETVQRRSLMTNNLKIQIASQRHVACFTAFDIIYIDRQPITDLPLVERKELLQSVFLEESSLLAISRYIEEKGIALYELTEQYGLEGIVAKKKDSKYYFDKRTKDWIKIKNMKDSDYVICGYIRKSNHMVSIVIGQYDGDQLMYKGHVTLGVNGAGFRMIQKLPEIPVPEFVPPPGNERTVWVTPVMVCSVKYMEKMRGGGLRQPVFKGIRQDKDPKDCKMI